MRMGQKRLGVGARGGLVAALLATATAVWAAGALAAVPNNQTPPSISGSAREGQTLTASNGTWANNPTSFRYQWQRCSPAGSDCAAIASATNQNYTLASADVDHSLRVVVTAVNGDGQSNATSQTTDVVSGGNAPTNTFGIYDPYADDPKSTLVQLFGGSATPITTVTLSFAGLMPKVGDDLSGKTFTSTTFGFYIGNIQGNPNTTYFSQASLNPNGDEHFVAIFGGSNSFVTELGGSTSFSGTDAILAFEDLPLGSSDKDYNDMVLMIRVQPRQVPDTGATALMMLGGLLALAGLRRKLA